MKKLALTILFLTLLFGAKEANAFTINRTFTNELGLLAHWTFDGRDMTGGRARDVSGNGNNALLTNTATSTVYGHGYIGQGIGLDGVDDYASTTSQIVLTGEFTTSFWAKNDNDAVIRMFLGTNTFTHTGKIGRGVSANKFFVRVINAGSSDNTVDTPRDSKWHHIVLRRDSSNKVDLIIDNGTVNRLFSDVAQSGNYVIGAIGRADSTSVQPANGLMDDVRIYNRALSASEVKQLYNQSSYKIATSPTAGIALNQGLVGYWTFDGRDMSTGLVRDVSGNGRHGSQVGTATSTFYTPGKVGQATIYDGVDDYVNITAASSIDFAPGANLSMSMWFRADTLPSSGNTVVMTSKSSLSNRDVSLQLLNTAGTVNIRAWAANNGSQAGLGSTAISRGVWYHFVATFNNTTNTTRVYLNGVLDGTNSGSTSDFGSGNPNMEFGRWMEDGTLDYNGSMDDVRLYNRELSAAEVKQLYNQSQTVISSTIPTGVEQGLSLYYTFDGRDVAGGTIRDVSGNGNHGTTSNIATSTFYQPGKIGQGVRFDGINDQVYKTSPSNLSLTEWTIAAWGKYNSNSVFAINYSTSTASAGAGMLHNGGWRCQQGGITTTQIATYTGKWVHNVCTFDGTNLRYYENGVLQRTTAATSFAETVNLFSLGSNVAGSFDIGANLDDVRIYNRALSAAEARQLFYGN